jgi:hypothetical protein
LISTAIYRVGGRPTSGAASQPFDDQAVRNRRRLDVSSGTTPISWTQALFVQKHVDFTFEIDRSGVKCTQQYGCSPQLLRDRRPKRTLAKADEVQHEWGYLTRPI